MTPHSSSIAFFSSTSSSTVILPSVSSTFAVSVAISCSSSSCVVFVGLIGLRPPWGFSPPAPPGLGSGSAGSRPGLLDRSLLDRSFLDRGSSTAAAAGSHRPDVVAPLRAARSGRRSARRGSAAARSAPRRAGVSGATITPTSCAWRTSSGGSLARLSISASVIDLPSSTPPRNARIFVSRAASLSAFATATGSPPASTNAIAVGPSSSASSASAPAASAARRVSVFLTTVKPGPVFEQLDPQACELAVREPAVVGDDQRVRRAQPLGQLLDHSLLVCFVHLSPPLETIEPARRRARREPESSPALSVRHLGPFYA